MRLTINVVSVLRNLSLHLHSVHHIQGNHKVLFCWRRTVSTALAQAIDRLPKGTLRTMQVDSKILQGVITPEIKSLADLFDKHGYELRMAGGAVRDIISGEVPHDIDFATTATPDEMKTMFEEEGVRMINAKGERHGTITARINDKENFEVTTLRIDVTTDGRHAEVEWTKNWELDAARRDLTVNSMFLDLKGQVYDYFNGAEDLKDKKVRFVGDPVQRIQEDYLRILRYFRFYGRICESEGLHEESTLKAIRDNVQGLAQISGERIWMELSKILSGRFAGHLVKVMLSLGTSTYIGLPPEDRLNLNNLALVYDRLQKIGESYNSVTLLASLLDDQKDVDTLNARLKMSAFERDLAHFIVLHRDMYGKLPNIKGFLEVLMYSKSNVSSIKLWVEEVYKYNGNPLLLQEWRDFELPKFPISGHRLLKEVPHGRTMTHVLIALKGKWMSSDFKLTEDELHALVPQILEELPQLRNSPKKGTSRPTTPPK